MSVRDDIAAGKYENHVPYSPPPMPEIDETKTTIARAREIREAYQASKLDQHRLHQEEGGRLTTLLKADLEAENGVVGHPKANLLWSLAWEHGHSSGYSDVVNYYDNFVELLK